MTRHLAPPRRETLRRRAAMSLLLRPPSERRISAARRTLTSARVSDEALVGAFLWATSGLHAPVPEPVRGALVDVMTLAACCDGLVRPSELGVLANAVMYCPALARADLVFHHELIASASRLVAEGTVSRLDQIGWHLAGDADRLSALRLAAVVILADAELSPQEPWFLRELAGELGLPEETLAETVATAYAHLGERH